MHVNEFMEGLARVAEYISPGSPYLELPEKSSVLKRNKYPLSQKLECKNAH
jgi:hypothetical protein